MCANYTPSSRLQLVDLGLLAPTFDYGEAFPGSRAPVVRRDARGNPECLPATFGLMPSWARPDLFRMTYNARCETVATKPAFRDAWRAARTCWVPAQAIYEPNYESGRAVRWRIAGAGGAPLAIAGLWESRSIDGHPAWSFTMLTINADDHPLMSRMHAPGKEKRSVVLLDEDSRDDWLDARTPAQRLALLRPFPAGRLVAAPAPRTTPPRAPDAALPA